MQFLAGLAMFTAAIASIIFTKPREEGLFAVLVAKPAVASIVALGITVMLLFGLILLIAGGASLLSSAA